MTVLQSAKSLASSNVLILWRTSWHLQVPADLRCCMLATGEICVQSSATAARYASANPLKHLYTVIAKFKLNLIRAGAGAGKRAMQCSSCSTGVM